MLSLVGSEVVFWVFHTGIDIHHSKLHPIPDKWYTTTTYKYIAEKSMVCDGKMKGKDIQRKRKREDQRAHEQDVHNGR